MSLKESWKETGVGLGHAFRDLGKTIVKTAKTGVDKADEWASSDGGAPKAEAPKTDSGPDQTAQ